MPNKRSAKKQLRQAPKRRFRNRYFASVVKSQVKKIETAITSKDAEVAQGAFREAVQQLDKVADKGIIHKKTAARKKSRLHKRLVAMLAGAGPSAQGAQAAPKTE